ncbi:MAG: lanthionine synthetase C family protein [Flavobacteriaceae bacterium]|nr:lanthionine synthetase C family protein [Flavobacteriaceae bacterium]
MTVIRRMINEIIKDIYNSIKKTPTGQNASLIAGELGELLFLVEYNKVFNVNDESIIGRLEDVISNSLNLSNDTTLSNGLCGFAWFLQYLINTDSLEVKEVEELLITVDEAAYKSALNDIKKNNHDFLHGGIGKATYLLTRVKQNGYVEKYLIDILSLLENNAIHSPFGICWVEQDFDNTLSDDNPVLLGLAHGLASKVVFLTKMLNANIECNRVKKILIGSVKYLLNHKNKKDEVSIFPFMVSDKEVDAISRLSWCHGDLGISIALWQAGEVLKNDSLKKEAISICLETTKRVDKSVTFIKDAGFCHGTAGVAYLYKRMYQYTGNSTFSMMTDYWIDETIKFAKWDDGVAGFKLWHNASEKWVKDYGLLSGVAGIGLVLLAAYSTKSNLSWDELFLLS